MVEPGFEPVSYSEVHVLGHKVLSLGPERLLKKGKPAPLSNYSILFLDKMKENNISSRTCSVPYVCQNYECSKKIKLLEAKMALVSSLWFSNWRS